MPEIQKSITQIICRNHDHILSDPTYPYRLFCQELLQFPVGLVEKVDRVVEEIIESAYAGNLPLGGVFHSLPYYLYLRAPSQMFREVFVETARKISHLPRSLEGAWLHPRGRFGGGHALLLDSFQEEAAQIAILSRLPESSGAEPEICVEQFRIVRQILRDPSTGLWHNGRGWIAEDPQALSPAAWSRGHGWVLRGLMTSILNLSPGASRDELISMFRESAENLVPVVDTKGMWAVLLDQPSAPEVSGSAMIAAVFLSAVRLNLLPEQPYRPLALKTAETVFTEYVDSEGRISGVCPGPGPLIDQESYLVEEFSCEDSHGPFALCALASAVLDT